MRVFLTTGAGFITPRFSIERHTGTAGFKQASVVVEVAAKFKVLGKAAVVQHAPGITAHGEGFVSLNVVVFVEDECLR